MQVENNKEEVPFSYYEGLFRKLDPRETAERLPCLRWDGKEFYVNLLGREYAIAHPDYAIRSLDGGRLPALPTQTFLLRFLLEGKQLASAGNWLTFREMPWGELYIKPYTGRVLTRAAFTFGTRVAAFSAAAEKVSSCAAVIAAPFGGLAGLGCSLLPHTGQGFPGDKSAASVDSTCFQ